MTFVAKRLYNAQDGTAVTGAGFGNLPRIRGLLDLIQGMQQIPDLIGEIRAQQNNVENDPFAELSTACALGDQAACAALEDMLTGADGATGSTSQQQVVFPPVLDVLTEQRARRGERQARGLGVLQGLTNIASQTLPRGTPFIPGFEPGGLADVLLGVVSGKGVERARREVPRPSGRTERINVDPLLRLIAEPDVAEELPSAIGMANQILDQLRRVQVVP